MKFERKIKKNGGSLGVLIPADIIKYLDLKSEDDIVLEVKNGQHGRYVAVWKKEDETHEDTNPTQ